ncbi:FtsX-like permease family protein [compost metagenome]
MVLSAVGVYGVVAYDVRQRRREFAVRSALGASAIQIIGEVTSRSVRLGIVGVAVGVVTAFAGTRLLGALLYQVDPADPGAFVTGTVVLLIIVSIASYLPARRAVERDAAAVLRD